jgi:formate dehydrogenase major subunit
VSDGLRLRVATAGLTAFRRTTLELLARHVDPAVAARLPEKPLHAILRDFAIEATGTAVGAAVDDSHPLLRVDLSQCVACLRCVSVCEDLQGQSVWHLFGRGETSRIGWDRGEQFAGSSCVACGACTDACPTGALVDSRRLTEAPPTDWVRTTCAYCGVGCELEAGVRDGRVIAARPVADAPVSKGHLCVKGRYGFDFGAAGDRVTTPLLRHGREWRRATWEEAIGAAGGGLRRIIAAHGPDAVGVLASARATHEETFLTQKFARLAIGTNNVDCCARVCHTPTAAAMKRMLGTGAATNSFDDIERAGTILVAGANPTANHPVVGARLKQQVRRGARLVVIDPRRTELAGLADVHLQLRPGTDVPLLNAIAHEIITNGWLATDFLATRVEGLEALREFLGQYPVERAAGVCGVPAAAIRAAARLYATAGPAMAFHGLGITEHLQGTETVMALVNLALLTGNLGRPGSGINPLRGQNNVQGAAIMGCDPEHLAGGRPLPEARAAFEAEWGATLPAGRGLNLLEMVDAAETGRLKALYVVGYDVLLTLANTHRTRAALAQLELVIVQDPYLTETARELGHVFLPVAVSFEKDGTFMNAERRVQRVRRAVDPPPGVPTDLEVIARLGAAVGTPLPAASAEAVWDEVRRLWPAVAGISYARLEAGGLQWPCPDERHPGTSLLHGQGFPGRARARLECVEWSPTPEVTSPDYPMLLTTGRDLYAFNAGTMTSRTAVGSLRPADTLDISPADARALGLADGGIVRLTSRYGATTLPLRLDDRVREGQLFATFHSPAQWVNRVTSDVRDRVTGAPEYKVTAVRIEAADPDVRVEPLNVTAQAARDGRFPDYPGGTMPG